MPKYKVTVVATLVFEIEAPRENAAGGAIVNAFRYDRPFDALQGTSIALPDTERECSDARLMTTTVAPGDLQDVELA